MIDRMIVITSLALMAVSLCLMLFHRKDRFDPRYLIPLYFGMIGIAALVVPDESWDLYRHYEALDEIKSNGTGFVDFMLGRGYDWGAPGYKGCYTFNLIRYAALLTGEYRLLPAVCVTINYGLFYLMIKDYCTEHEMSMKKGWLAMLLSYTLLLFIFVNSSLRNGCAAAVTSYAIYFYEKKKISRLRFIVLLLIACTFHFGALLYIVIYVFSRIKNLKIEAIAVILFQFVSFYLAKYMAKSSLPFIEIIGRYVVRYMGDGMKLSKDTYHIAVFIVVAAIALATFTAWRSKFWKNQSEMNKSLRYSILTIDLVSLIYSAYEVLSMRAAYALSFFTFPLVDMLCGVDGDDSKWNKRILLTAGLSSFLLVSLRMIPSYIIGLGKVFGVVIHFH